MPPSPAMRCSPGRVLRADNHKKGRSLESGLLYRERDDDLALFSEVQSRERDSFLLQSNDDFDDVFSTKLRYFSDVNKLGISIPARGQSSDLFNTNGEKKDYDWLLTPPDTPLFPSLDDETPRVNLAQRGRPQSKPFSISRSSTMEKSYRSNRGSASPNRLIASPQSGISTFQIRGRPSSIRQSSPTPSICHSTHSTPSRKSSHSPSNSVTPAPRSSTPTPRRISSGSSGTVGLSGVRGSSPAKTSRGNSVSPKIRAWKTNVTGFSLEAPPNLHTSQADRPSAYVRDSSPASRNGRDLSSKSGRQPMSPTASRSFSSSYHHEHDRLSSHSKGSIASSGDDEVESLQSVSMSGSIRSGSRRSGTFPNNRTPAFPKDSARTVSSISAPKRSVIGLQPMDHGKGPQNMFRPLLSSVPSSTFYVGQSNAANRAMISRNSLVTTSSKASSDQYTSVAHDCKGSEQNQEDVSSPCMKTSYPDVQDEVFFFDKDDALDEDVPCRSHDGSCSSHHGDFNGDHTVEAQIGNTEKIRNYDCTAVPITLNSETTGAHVDCSDFDDPKEMVPCSRCGSCYHAIESIGDLQLCPDCSKPDVLLTFTAPVTIQIIAGGLSSISAKITGEYKPCHALESVVSEAKAPGMIVMDGLRTEQYEEIAKDGEISSSEAISKSLPENLNALPLVEESAQGFASQEGIGQLPICHSLRDGEPRTQQMQHYSGYPKFEADVSEGAGIHVLLNTSSSVKGHVVQSRNFAATSISYDDLSYVGDSDNSSRSSFVLGSASASSSVDMGSARKTETHVQRQFSGKKYDVENYRYNVKPQYQHTWSSLSGISSHAFETSDLPSKTLEENIELAATPVKEDNESQTCVSLSAHLASESKEVVDSCTAGKCKNSCGADAIVSTTELSCHTEDIHVVASFHFEESATCENAEDFSNNARNISDTSSAKIPDSFVIEDTTVESCGDWMNIVDAPTLSSLVTISEIEAGNGHLESPSSQSDIVSLNSKSILDESYALHFSTISDKSPTASISESNTSDHSHGILEESTIMIGGQRGTQTRSLTLEEATDAILFCSSIIQNLAYEAATIAMEKENSVPLEGSLPTIMVLGQSNSDRKDPRGRTAGRRTSKSKKARQRPVKLETKLPSYNKTENDEKPDGSTLRIVGRAAPNKGDSMKPPKMESKCNCTVM